ncbi:MAG: YbeD family protein [Myxococcaceae bacterium]
MTTETKTREPISYPTRYPFKVMGRADPTFSDHVRALVAKALKDDVVTPDLTEVTSREGKYVSVTITMLLRSEAERRAIYEALHADERIVYYL